MTSLGLLRKLCGIDIVVLAERAGISRQCISAGENGSAFSRRPVLKRWNDALVDIVMERLVEGAKDIRTEALDIALGKQIARADLAEAELKRLRAAAAPPPEPAQKENTTIASE